MPAREYYIKNEERFGHITSIFYSFFSIRLSWMRDFHNFVINDIRKSKAKSIIDIGTGPATIPIEVCKGTDAKIYAIDPSLSMVKMAKKNMMKNKCKIEIKQGSSREIPFKRKFDIIYTSLSFHHWAEKEVSLSYLKRFLTEKGEIRIYEFKRKNTSFIHKLILGTHSLDMDEMKQTAKKANLKISSIKTREMMVRVSLAKKSLSNRNKLGRLLHSKPIAKVSQKEFEKFRSELSKSI